jgi:alpha-1,3-glucosyltransferase
MMYGIMTLAYVYLKEDKIIKSALMFAILLQFKHIYLYSAPAFGIYYLRKTFKNPKLFLQLAFQTCLTFLVTYLPVIWTNPIANL